VVSLTFKTWKFRGYFASTLVHLARRVPLTAATCLFSLASGVWVGLRFRSFFRLVLHTAGPDVVRLYFIAFAIFVAMYMRQAMLIFQRDVTRLAEGADDEFLALLQYSDNALCCTALTEQFAVSRDPDDL
jgi:hypothetical protein